MIRVAAAVLLLLLSSCDVSPTEPEPKAKDGCPGEEAFCAGRSIAPLDATDVLKWQQAANDYVDATYGQGRRVYPYVTWHACFFVVDGVCAAGWAESKDRIHVSTAEPERTGPLVAHESIHCIYAVRFGDFDPKHRRKYGW